LAYSYKRTNEFNKSFAYIRKAIKIKEQLYAEESNQLSSKGGRFTNVNLSIANSYGSLGVYLMDVEKYDSAHYYLNKAVDMTMKAVGKKRWEMAIRYDNIGRCYSKEGKQKMAIAYFEEARDILKEILPLRPRDRAMNYQLIAESNIKLGNWDNVFKYYQLALSELVENTDTANYGNPQIAGADFTSYLLKVFEGKAKAFRQYYRLESKNIGDLKFAYETYKLAVSLIDSILPRISSRRGKIGIFEKSSSILNGAVEVSYELYRLTEDENYVDEAFYFTEKYKSMLLMETLNESKAKNFLGFPDSILVRERNLKTDLAYYRSRLGRAEQKGEKTDSALVQESKNKVFDLSAEQAKLEDELKSKYPNYHNLKYNHFFVDIKIIQDSLLDDSEAILEYFLGDSVIVFFAITKETAQMFKMSSDTLFTKALNDLPRLLSRRDMEIDSFVNAM